MRPIVKKFGGTSVGSVERIQAVADRVARDRAQDQHPVVVVSAMSGETNRLIELGERVAPGNRGGAYDFVIASGEQVSAGLVALALESRGLRARAFLGFQVGIRTDSVHSRARIEAIDAQGLRAEIAEGVIPVITGFQGADASGRITTLGRGGSDLSAVSIAAALGLDSCEIYTDVAKVYTADPRLVPQARPIERLAFDEMMEMASLGSKVLHTRSVEVAAKFGVAIHLRSSFSEEEGTWITHEKENPMESPVVSAITHEKGTTIVHLTSTRMEPAFLEKLFGALARAHVSVDVITQSEREAESSLAFSVNSEDRGAAEGILRELNLKFEAHSGLAKLSVVGVGMRTHTGVAQRYFKALSQAGARPRVVSTSEIKISAVIDEAALAAAAQALHQEFGLDRES